MAKIKKKAALLSNITVDLIAAKLRGKYDFYLPHGFDTWIQEAIDTSSGVYSEDSDAVIVLLDGTEARSWTDSKEAAERISLWKQGLTALTSNINNIPILVSTIDIRENRIKAYLERKLAVEMNNDWYQFVQDIVEKNNNVYVLDIADTICEIGRKQFYSNKMWYMSSMPYSKNGLNAVINEIDRALRSAFEPKKKIIVLDLDNTLWGGVVGEDGLDGIELSNHKEGQRYYDFQRQLLEMKNRGILLAVNSKNNEADTERVIKNHPYMLLRDNAFVIKKINWKNKADNLKDIESELNLTEKSFIFIDDNPAEREIVRGICSDALVLDFPADTTELVEFAENIWFDYCRPLRVLGEDLKKTQMYQSEAERRQELNESLNLDDYIARLELSADIHKMRPNELERVTQLCGKTNQFNMTTKRYTQAEIKKISANSDNEIYVAYSSDKYGDSGLISVIILIGEEADVKIDTFLMSCRVMGRRLEDVIMNEIAAHCSDKRKIIGEFIPTAKNAPVKELYDRLGFELILDDDGHKIYELTLNDYMKKSFECYKEICFDE